MKGDFDRITFDSRKKFSKVNKQQGRVGCAADSNEQTDITNYFHRNSLTDVIGQSGYPRDNPGFFISINQALNTLNISKGHYYVDGILFENDKDLDDATKQTDLPPLSIKDGTSLAMPNIPGAYLVYLDGWERHITYVDDSKIREVALGGPDTSTRNKIVWQVKLLRLKGINLGGTIVATAEIGREQTHSEVGPGNFNFGMTSIEAQADPQGGPQEISFKDKFFEASQVGVLQLDFEPLTVRDPDANKFGAPSVAIKVEISVEPGGKITKEVTGSGDSFSIPVIVKRNSLQDSNWEVFVGDTVIGQFNQPVNQTFKISATYKYGNPDPDLKCDSDTAEEWNRLARLSDGLLTARTKPQEPAQDPCLIPPGGGYRQLGNQLYRVEIHHPGKIGEEGATFKWSRDNGSVITRVIDILNENKKIIVSCIGKDQLLGFNNQQWVEMIDDRHELLGIPGTMAQVNVVSDNELEVLPGTISGEDLTKDNYPLQFNPKVRRWDSTGATKIPTPTPNDDYLALEDGIEVKFNPARPITTGVEDGDNYRTRDYWLTGDYWLIPARGLIGDIEWEKDNNNTPISKPPDGTEHHYAKLALLLVDYDRDNKTKIRRAIDCRKQFPPLTDIGTSEKNIVLMQTHGNQIWLGPTRNNLYEFQKDEQGTTFVNRDPDPNGRVAKFHIPFSTSTYHDDSFSSVPQLTRAYLLFNMDAGGAEQDAGIMSISIYDGQTLRWRRKFEPFLSGQHHIFDDLNVWDIEVDFEGHPIQIKYGLGISVETLFDEGRRIEFSAAGVYLKYPD